MRWGLLVVVVGAVLGGRAYFSQPPSVAESPAEQAEARIAEEMLRSLPPPEATPAPELPRGRPAEELAGLAPPLPAPTTVLEQDGVTVEGAPFRARASGSGAFLRADGTDVGFAKLPLPPLHEALQPSENEYAPLAAGDVNADGWPDVVVGTAHGLFLYVNTGGQFALQELDFAGARGATVTSAALVDLDGSGTVDLFFCAWMRDCHVLHNTGGRFSSVPDAVLPRGDERATHSVAFSDLDRDGDLEIVTGPGTGLAWNFSPQTPVVVWQRTAEGQYAPQSLEGPGGETLTLLASDLDGDEWPDLYVGNDFDEPDLLYRNDNGRLVLQRGADNPFPRTTESTMSVESGDVDNDGIPEVYQAAIADGDRDGRRERTQPPHLACQDGFAARDQVADCLRLAEFQTAVVRSRDITDVRECSRFDDPATLRQCVAVGYQWNAAFSRTPSQGGSTRDVLERCRTFPELQTLRDVCDAAAVTPLDRGQAEKVLTDQAPQDNGTNLLFRRDGDRYVDVTADWDVAVGGWSWNARFGDVDNDTWQDLYVTQGSRLRFSNASNLLYRNEAGEGFTEQARAVGLSHHVPTGGSLFLDYDLDGRLDVVTHPFALTPVVWHNEGTVAESLEITLEDRRSHNSAAIGAWVQIRSPDGRLQVREVKASGGFESDDVKSVRFGLGDWPQVSALTVRWPDGRADEFDVPSLTSGRYTVRRT